AQRIRADRVAYRGQRRRAAADRQRRRVRGDAAVGGGGGDGCARHGIAAHRLSHATGRPGLVGERLGGSVLRTECGKRQQRRHHGNSPREELGLHGIPWTLYWISLILRLRTAATRRDHIGRSCPAQPIDGKGTEANIRAWRGTRGTTMLDG